MNIPEIIKNEFGDISHYCQSPEFWIATPAQAAPFLAHLSEANIRKIGYSAGNREIIAIEYGEKEKINATTNNFQAALTSAGRDPAKRYPAAFFGTDRRRKPVIILQGALHGGELTGTVAALNLCNIIEHGCDLRGRQWPELRDIAKRSRLLIIPWLNPDGATRCPFPCPAGVPHELYSCFTFGIDRDGRKLPYAYSKTVLPLDPATMQLLGSYFNDNGQNLQYDFCLSPRQPETETWIRYCLEEKPDAMMIMHCDNGSMLSVASHILPPGLQSIVNRLGGAVYHRLRSEGFAVRRATYGNLPDFGLNMLDQVGATYLTCGTTPFLTEFPAGSGMRKFSPDELLDIGLITIEEVLCFAHREGFRPGETWEEDIASNKDPKK